MVHERLVEVVLPGDLILAPNMMLALTDTETGFDQLYYIETIVRKIDPRNGFTQHIRAKNASPRSSSTIGT